MSIKSGYKQTEIGIIPEDWEVVELGEILEYEQPTKYLVETENYNTNFNIPVLTAGKTFILGYTNETNGIYNDLPVIIFDDFTTASKYVDFPFKAKSSAMKILKIKDKSYPTKLFYEYIQSLDFIASTHKRYWISEYSKIKIPFPPLEEQKKIADILSTVDKKIAFVEENINATEELKKGLMQKLLTEGIGHTEFKDSSIGKVPSSWKVVKLVEAISIMTDYVANGSFASLAANVNVYDEPNYAIYVRLFDLRKGLGHSEQKYVDEESYKFLSKSNLEGREILIANIGANVGETFLMPDINKPATLAPNMIEVKVDPEKLISEFLYFYLTGHIGLKELEKVTEGSGQPKINKTKLKTINAPLPDLEEQSKIIEILSTVDKKLENLKEKKQSFEELKKGLMQKLLTGEVRV